MVAKILMFALGGLAIGCGGAVYEITSDADSGDADGGQSGFGAPGCRPDPCTPPPPFCAPNGDNMCGPPQPGTRDVTCVCG